MTLRELLLCKTKVDDIIIFRLSGYRIGCTMIDYEDLFIHSIDNNLLEKEIIDYHYIEQDWTTKKVMEVNMSSNKEAPKVKLQGFFSGNIYDEDYPRSDIGECCRQLSNDEITDKEQNRIRAEILKKRGEECKGCPRSRRGE